MSDSDVIGRILRAAGLVVRSIEPTEPVHPQLVQYQATDWDFMLSRADVMGRVVVADDGQVSLARMAVDGAPSLRITYGDDVVYGFEFEVDATRQDPSIEGEAWDVGNRTMTQPPKQARDTALPQGNLDVPTVAGRKLGFGVHRLVHPAPWPPRSWSPGQAHGPRPPGDDPRADDHPRPGCDQADAGRRARGDRRPVQREGPGHRRPPSGLRGRLADGPAVRARARIATVAATTSSTSRRPGSCPRSPGSRSASSPASRTTRGSNTARRCSSRGPAKTPRRSGPGWRLPTPAPGEASCSGPRRATR